MSSNNCTNDSSIYSDPSIYNGAFIWLLFMIILFRGLPLNNNIFWDGYINAFSSSTFTRNSIFNKVYPSSHDFNNLNNSTFNNSNDFVNSISNSDLSSFF